MLPRQALKPEQASNSSSIQEATDIEDEPAATCPWAAGSIFF